MLDIARRNIFKACLAGAAALRAPKSVGAAFFRTDNRPRVCSVNGRPWRPLEGGALPTGSESCLPWPTILTKSTSLPR